MMLENIKILYLYKYKLVYELKSFLYFNIMVGWSKKKMCRGLAINKTVNNLASNEESFGNVSLV